MPKQLNTTSLMGAVTADESDGRPTVIAVEHVSMVFNIANQQLNNLKEYAIALARRELMFKEFVALDDISLEVKKGDVFGILGTNGSGKSTLLKIIAGVLEPTRGEVTIHGSIAPLIELGAGFDFELTARENIYLNGALLGYSRKFIDEHFDDIVEFAEIGEFLDMPIKNYSSGMVARIAFAIATVIVPDILIVDEVLSVGDFMFQRKCEQKIQTLINEHEVTVLIVSHNNDQIERLCNKAIWIEKGHTRIVGTAEEVCGVYRALGGHTGSPQAEATVLDLIESDASPDEGALEVFAGDTRYDTNVLLAKRSRLPERATIVLADGEDGSAHLMAVALAGALDGAALIAKTDRLADATALLIARLDPARIVVLEGPKPFSEEFDEALAHAAGPSCELVRLSGRDAATLSREALAYATGRSVTFAPIAFVAGEQCSIVSATVAPYLARHASQLLLSTAAVPLEVADVEDLIGRGAEEIVLLGDAVLTGEVADAIRDANVLCTRLSGDTPAEAHRIALHWLVARHRATDAPLNRLVLTTLAGPSDGYSAATLAAQDHGLIMMADHNDLDSMAAVFAFIDGEEGGVDSMAVIGNDACFNATDRKLMGKALARAKGSRPLPTPYRSEPSS